MPDVGTQAPAPACATCGQEQQSAGQSLKKCSRCGTKYCSRDCQRADWKEHKKVCVDRMHSLPGTNSKTFLHQFSKDKVYELLIDCYRMRIDVYGGGNPMVGFREFVKRAEERSNLLPPWWNAGTRVECIAKGDAQDDWSAIDYDAEKSNINERYKSPTAAIQLFMLMAEIEGTSGVAL